MLDPCNTQGNQWATSRHYSSAQESVPKDSKPDFSQLIIGWIYYLSVSLFRMVRTRILLRASFQTLIFFPTGWISQRMETTACVSTTVSANCHRRWCSLRWSLTVRAAQAETEMSGWMWPQQRVWWNINWKTSGWELVVIGCECYKHSVLCRNCVETLVRCSSWRLGLI